MNDIKRNTIQEGETDPDCSPTMPRPQIVRAASPEGHDPLHSIDNQLTFISLFPPPPTLYLPYYTFPFTLRRTFPANLLCPPSSPLDTIDLQDHVSPSAQDHSHLHSPLNANAPNTSLAPHQAETLRSVAAESADENSRSPRGSWGNGAEPDDLQLYAQDLASGVASKMSQQQQDTLAIAQNGGTISDDADMDDVDDGLDDDMDKISSSPSIEDGAFPTPGPGNWPARRASLCQLPTPRRLHFTPSSGLHLAAPTVKLSASSGADFKQLELIQGVSSDDAVSRVTSRQGNPEQTNTQDFVEPGDIEIIEDVNALSQDLLGIPDACENAPSQETADQSPSSATGKSSSEDNQYTGDDDNAPINPLSLVDICYIDSGWDAECLHDLEDIDFEFVYALHTFVATVEGQANATKGDTMVLLDDSNSYWWLVRVVKDSSIGYLPAEHIETPTERLARLNKHRNIDLSATMLGDQTDKPKNPIKSAMRRRKAKTVTFADPTIHAYSDYEYSSEEDDLENDFLVQQQQQQQQQIQQAQEQQAQQQQEQQQQTDQGDLEDESAKVQPLNMRSQGGSFDSSTQDDKLDANSSRGSEDTRTSDEIFDSKPEPSRSRNGTVRNTDSFFKDETVETKKITLTPNLLRDDNEPRASSDSKDLRSRPSLDKLERDDKKDDKRRKEKDKKEKDKKPGVIRSLFSRGKDKKKSPEDDGEYSGKRSFDTMGELREKVSEDFSQAPESPIERQGPQRHPSKLQKQQPQQQPRGDHSPTRKQASAMEPPAVSMRLVGPEPKPDSEESQRPDDVASPEDTKQSAEAVVQPSGVRMVPPESKDDAQSSPVKQAEASEPRPKEPERNPSRPDLPGAYPDSHANSAATTPAAEEPVVAPQQRERLSESPVHVSPVNTYPPALIGDSSSQEGHSSPISSPSPELVEAEDDDGHRNQDSITTSTSTGTMSSWNDANLRAFFDSGSDIRDLLSVIYDKSDVAPAGPDHPVVGPLFKESNAKLAEITNQLDNMLGDWLARKQRTRGTL
ncbi:hypothetical protein MKZ38_007198 [Zalerion maritima]|uniref:SH3 domain-containing protein n=1 Tax=Zalerion maritima TaxID=339359 RepID=A0AAD5RMW7_9PEZI|nr:hypothetical protein MKZ38_007198 [Zalerion maritima]